MARGSTRVLSCKVCCVASFIGAAVMSAGLACGMQAASQPSTQPAGKQPTDETTPAAAKPKNTKPLVAKPHPLICEILYSVPKGEEGDADQNGSRSATGDEFIEISKQDFVAVVEPGVNTALLQAECEKLGIWEKYGVRMIGVDTAAIELTENRESFRQLIKISGVGPRTAEKMAERLLVATAL
mgnify:CR=1 FL=1